MCTIDGYVFGACYLLAVFLVNIPYTIVPLVLMWRVRHPDPFGNEAAVA